MNRRHRNTFRKLMIATAGTIVAAAALLWSWNTLAPLFGGPSFEFRHAVALLIALIAVRIAFGSRPRHRVFEDGQEAQS